VTGARLSSQQHDIRERDVLNHWPSKRADQTTRVSADIHRLGVALNAGEPPVKPIETSANQRQKEPLFKARTVRNMVQLQ